ncbi:MAG: TRAP transporter small permease [Rhodospirillaceae bacterium]|nr:TRAP transporter small permease [Rhodospirillaceae bacterium]
MNSVSQEISEQNTIRPKNHIGQGIYFLSKMAAILGGLIMTGLIAMVAVSATGRYFFSTPIYGDFEMVALGTAITVFLFLPYCQMRRGNVIVDLFLSWAPKKVQTAFDVVGALLLAVISAVLAWRMTLGGFNAIEYNETTYILALPLWWAYPFAVLSFALLFLASIYTAIYDLIRIFRD